MQLTGDPSPKPALGKPDGGLFFLNAPKPMRRLNASLAEIENYAWRSVANGVSRFLTGRVFLETAIMQQVSYLLS